MSNHWRIHICTPTKDQLSYYHAICRWLRVHGHHLLADRQAALPIKLEAARTCDLCLLVLGSQFGRGDPLSFFSDAELEASIAVDTHPGKLLVFAQSNIEQPNVSKPPMAPEQREFIERLSNFGVGSFRATVKSRKDLITQIEAALLTWQPPAPHQPPHPIQVSPGAVMISSTGDLQPEREVIRSILEKQHLPVIDYLHAPSESVTPIDRVMSWARECQALVLILGERYGFVSPVDGLGVTELEFVTALQAKRPILAFIRDDAPSPGVSAGDEDQQQFVERVLKFVPPERIFFFQKSLEGLELLKQQLHLGLSLLAKDQYSPWSPEEVAPEVIRRWYRRQLKRWLGILPHFTQPQGMPLRSSYVSLLQRVPQEQPPRGHINKEALFEKRRPQPQTIAVEEALHRYPRLVIRGAAGAGKSVILRWYAIMAAEEITPLFIRLASYARARWEGKGSQLLEAIAQEEERLALHPGVTDSQWVAALKSGQGLILLDGLDEVPLEQQSEIVADIQMLVDQLPEASHVVVTMRPGLKIQIGAPFTEVEVQPLTEAQQEEFVEQWLRAAHAHSLEDQAIALARSQSLIQFLKSTPRLAEWAQTPLLLTFLAALADTPEADLQTLPTAKATIYRRVMRLLLGRWQTLNFRQGTQHLWAKQQVLFALTKQRLFDDRGEIVSHEDIERTWEGLIQSGQDGTTGAELLRELHEQDGLLVRLSEGQFAFLHPTFQEYLAVMMIASHPRKEADREINRMIKQIGETFCRQVIIELAQHAHQQKPALEDYLYRKVIALLGSAKEKMRRAQQKKQPNLPTGSAISWGIDAILLELVDHWGQRMMMTLDAGSRDELRDGEVASTIGSVFQRAPRAFALPALIRAIDKYEKRGRFIEALGEIGTGEAQAALLRLTQDEIASGGDPYVFPFLATALTMACPQDAITLLEAMLDGDYHEEAKERARRLLKELSAQDQPTDLSEILADLKVEDEKGRPSDWRRVRKRASWLEFHGSQNGLVQTHLAEILSALQIALGHLHDGARVPVAAALGRLGNAQTFEFIMSLLANHKEVSTDVARVMLSASVQLVERKQFNQAGVEDVLRLFPLIRQHYPTLREVISETEQRIRENIERKR